MMVQGFVKDGVVVLSAPSALPEGTLVNVMPVDEAAQASVKLPRQENPYPVSQERKEALLGLIGLWKVDNPPSDEEVDRMIEEERMRKYG